MGVSESVAVSKSEGQLAKKSQAAAFLEGWKTGAELKNLETTPNTTSLTQQAKSLEVGRLNNVHWRNDFKLKGVTNQLIKFHSRFMLTIASFGRNLT